MANKFLQTISLSAFSVKVVINDQWDCSLGSGDRFDFGDGHYVSISHVDDSTKGDRTIFLEHLFWHIRCDWEEYRFWNSFERHTIRIFQLFELFINNTIDGEIWFKERDDEDWFKVLPANYSKVLQGLREWKISTLQEKSEIDVLNARARRHRQRPWPIFRKSFWWMLRRRFKFPQLTFA